MQHDGATQGLKGLLHDGRTCPNLRAIAYVHPSTGLQGCETQKDSRNVLLLLSRRVQQHPFMGAPTSQAANERIERCQPGRPLLARKILARSTATPAGAGGARRSPKDFGTSRACFCGASKRARPYQKPSPRRVRNHQSTPRALRKAACGRIVNQPFLTLF